MIRGVKPADICIIAAVLLLSCGIFAVHARQFSGSAQRVDITVDGKLYATYPFSERNSAKVVEIQTKFGYNKVEIAKTGVRVMDADCPDKLDVRTNPITRPGQSIICLPNRLVITLAGDTSVDGVAY